MNALKRKAKAGVTLVELLVVILIITILSVSLLPLLKPYIEQSKYAAEVQPTVANIQTKINLYQYEKDQLPCTKVMVSTDNKKEEVITDYDQKVYTWTFDSEKSSERLRAYKAAIDENGTLISETDGSDPDGHLSTFVDVKWQEVMGRRMNPSQVKYHLIKGLGSSRYGYAVGVFGDGDGLALGTGYAVLVLVDTDNKAKIIATWERYSSRGKPEGETEDSAEVVRFAAQDSGAVANNVCVVPTANWLKEVTSKESWATLLGYLKRNDWSFNFDEYNAN